MSRIKKILIEEIREIRKEYLTSVYYEGNFKNAMDDASVELFKRLKLLPFELEKELKFIKYLENSFATTEIDNLRKTFFFIMQDSVTKKYYLNYSIDIDRTSEEFINEIRLIAEKNHLIFHTTSNELTDFEDILIKKRKEKIRGYFSTENPDVISPNIQSLEDILTSVRIPYYVDNQYVIKGRNGLGLAISNPSFIFNIGYVTRTYFLQLNIKEENNQFLLNSPLKKIIL